MPRIRPAKSAPADKIEIIEDDDMSVPTEEIVIELSPEELDALPPIEGADPAPSPAPAPAPAPAPDDDPVAKALEAQRHAEELQRQYQRERDEMQRQMQQHQAELARAREERADAEYSSVLTGIAAEEAAIQKAEGDYTAAMQAGDYAAASKAQSEMSRAAARLDRLQVNKSSLDQVRETQPAPQVQRQDQRSVSVDQQIDAMNIASEAKVWLRRHPEFVSDQTKVRQINAVHDYLVQVKQVPQFTADYFDQLETQLGIKTAPAAPAPAPAPAPQPQPQQRRSMPVTAPVSREVPTSTGERPASTGMTLTPEERFIARNSFTDPNMTNAQKERLYAMNKAKLARERAAGRYPARERA
jgi:hypothetical protein